MNSQTSICSLPMKTFGSLCISLWLWWIWPQGRRTGCFVKTSRHPCSALPQTRGGAAGYVFNILLSAGYVTWPAESSVSTKLFYTKKTCSNFQKYCNGSRPGLQLSQLLVLSSLPDTVWWKSDHGMPLLPAPHCVTQAFSEVRTSRFLISVLPRSLKPGIPLRHSPRPGL